MTTDRPAFPHGSLNEELDAFRATCEREWPPEALKMVDDTLTELAHTGIESVALKAGDEAPSFTLPDHQGHLVSSQTLLDKGPLVLAFYRGMW